LGRTVPYGGRQPELMSLHRIDLGNTYDIDGFIVQADDNDAINYITGWWTPMVLAWDVPNYDDLEQECKPDPDPDNNSVPYYLGSPITTYKLKFTGDVYNTDGLYQFRKYRPW